MSKESDPEGDRLKSFEAVTDLTLDPQLPIIIRLDGRAFHTWTTCVERPFDPRLNGLMDQTMLSLASAVGARYCYTQSDEITLVCLAEGKSQPIFGGRVLKICSLIAKVWCSPQSPLGRSTLLRKGNREAPGETCGQI